MGILGTPFTLTWSIYYVNEVDAIWYVSHFDPT